MARYIDADLFLKSAISDFKCVPCVGVETFIGGETYLVGESLDDVINRQPTADVKEVVRCAKCAFYDIEKYNCRKFDCNMPCDGYCSKGKPKNDKE